MTNEELIDALVKGLTKDLDNRDFRSRLLNTVRSQLKKVPIEDKTLPVTVEIALGFRITYYGEGNEARG